MIVIKRISFLHHLGFSGTKSLEQHSCLLHSQDVLKPLMMQLWSCLVLKFQPQLVEMQFLMFQCVQAIYNTIHI